MPWLANDHRQVLEGQNTNRLQVQWLLLQQHQEGNTLQADINQMK